ncbi:MAG: siphovirus Gp157 family protein [Limosilactobacillus mucosae]|nr:siphovirus Gp157 family protein [Limosilactobacillus mucosae]
MNTAEIIAAIATVDQKRAEGEIDKQSYTDTIDSLQLELADKLDAIAWLINDTEKDLAIYNHELEKMADIKKERDKAKARVDRLQEYIGYIVANSGSAKVRTDKHVYTKRKSEKVEFSDQALIPDQYYKEKVTVKREPSKTDIKKAIKAGQDVPGAYIATNYKGVIK